MAAPDSRAKGGLSLLQTAKDLIREDADNRRTIHLGGTTAANLTKILAEDHVVCQLMLKSERATDCERETASLRLIVIEEVLGQMGVDLESDSMTTLSHDDIRAIDRLSKRALADELYRWADEHHRSWIVGGPAVWSKDELVSAVVRIRTGGRP